MIFLNTAFIIWKNINFLFSVSVIYLDKIVIGMANV